MGLPVLILGESGSGKTYSLKNFEPNEISIFSVEKSTYYNHEYKINLFLFFYQIIHYLENHKRT